MADPVKALAEGQPTITPCLVIQGAARAIEFYVRAFGAEELYRMTCPETGAVMHAAIRIGNSRVFLGDECPSMGIRGPESIGGSPVTIHLYVDDVDRLFDQAVGAGATVTMPLANQFWGDRYGRLVDPFGHQWSLATHVEDLTPEQMHARMLEAFAQPAAS